MTRHRHHLFLLIFSALIFVQCIETEKGAYQHDNSMDDLFLMNGSEDLVLQAHEISLKAPVSIHAEKSVGYDFGPGTYVSLACYWWPDPSNENGLPYIRDDGNVNPETRSEASDLPAMIEMAKRVELLSGAYMISGDETFAEQAVEQLQTWFVDQNSAMLPHLEHAQMVRGRDSGRSYGIIDTWWLVRVIHSIPVLQRSGYWSDKLETGLKNWFTHYLNWLRNSEFGLEEMRSKNNHGTWYDVQVVLFANYVGQQEYAAQHIESITKKRLNRQITRSGRQRYEARRPKPEHYSIYNLNGWFELLTLAENLEIELQQKSSPWSGTIKDALFHLINSMQEIHVDEILDPIDRTDTDRLYLDLLLKSVVYFNHPAIFEEIKRIKPQVRNPELILLRTMEMIDVTKGFSNH
ncbi:MAG: alginate lyase family protein [Balneolaceae bacterium]|nr:alginate lyase family protein [Balneolaceae bacterium]